MTLGKPFHFSVSQFINLPNSYFPWEAFCNLHLENATQRLALLKTEAVRLQQRMRRRKAKIIWSCHWFLPNHMLLFLRLPLIFLRARKTTAPSWWLCMSTTQGSFCIFKVSENYWKSPEVTTGFQLGIWQMKVHSKLIPPLVKGEEEPLWLFVVARSCMPARDVALLQTGANRLEADTVFHPASSSWSHTWQVLVSSK